MILANIDDYRRLARKRLPHFLFEYIDGGAFSETTLRNNQLDLQQIALRQRALHGRHMVMHRPHGQQRPGPGGG